jgi:hypothetical protein
LDELEGVLCGRLRQKEVWTGAGAIAFVQLAIADARQRVPVSASASATAISTPPLAPAAEEAENEAKGAEEERSASGEQQSSDVGPLEHHRALLEASEQIKPPPTVWEGLVLPHRAAGASGTDAQGSLVDDECAHIKAKSPRADGAPIERLSLSASHRTRQSCNDGPSPPRDNASSPPTSPRDSDIDPTSPRGGDHALTSPRDDVGPMSPRGGGALASPRDVGPTSPRGDGASALPCDNGKALGDGDDTKEGSEDNAETRPAASAPHPKPVMSARGPRPAGRAPRPSLATPWTPEGTFP